MGDPRLVAILDHFITAFREYRVEDLAKDEQLQFIDKMLEVLRVWRKEAEQK